MFTASTVEKKFYTDSVPACKRGKCFSLNDVYGSRGSKAYIGDTKVHDSNFAFLQSELAKLHTKLYEPQYFVTYLQDVPVNYGGGFVDYVSYYTVDWAGIMNEFKNVVGNNANYIPRVNAGLTQKMVNVYTFEIAYDLRFVELEKMKKLSLQKSIQEIYQNAIVAGWDLFCQKVAYLGMENTTGLFNSTKVKVTTIDNSGTTGQGFEGLSDQTIVSFFNGIFSTFLANTNGGGYPILPDKILVPTFVGKDLTDRMSDLYTSTLREFIVSHNLAIDESDGSITKIDIKSRPDLDALGTAAKGRIVAYKKNESYVRLDVPYAMQHYITLPNVEKMSYTSAFVGQVSEIQMPYNQSNSEFGVVAYFDFTD